MSFERSRSARGSNPLSLHADKLSIAIRIRFHDALPLRVVAHPAIGAAASKGRVERGLAEAHAFVPFPFVDAAVAIGVFLGAHQHLAAEILVAIRTPIAHSRARHLHLTIWSRSRARPGVFHAVTKTRRSDQRQRRALIEVLPTIDASVVIGVGFASQRPVAVQIRPLIDAAITVLIRTQLHEAAGEVVVVRYRASRPGSGLATQ